MWVLTVLLLWYAVLVHGQTLQPVQLRNTVVGSDYIGSDIRQAVNLIPRWQLGKVVGTGIDLSPASDSAISQGKGLSLSWDGRILAVGSPGDDNDIGSTRIYVSNGPKYEQLGNKLVGNDAVGPKSFQGRSVSLSSNGRVLAVGAPAENKTIGATWIFLYDGSEYRQLGSKLVGNETAGGSSGQGNSVSLSSDGILLAVGGPEDDGGKGATWIFKYDGSKYYQLGPKLVDGQSSFSKLGSSVSLSSNGTILAVGGPGGSSSVGATWIFIHKGSSYEFGSKLCVKNMSGLVLNQGGSLSLSSDGGFLAVGSTVHNVTDNVKVGAAWIFVYNGSAYQQLGTALVGKGSSGSNSSLVPSVSLSSDGRTLGVGGAYDEGGVGAVWIFVYKNSTYQQLGNKLVGSNSSGLSYQGWSVSLSGEDGRVLAVGGYGDNNYIGATWIYVFNGANYEQVGEKLVGRKLGCEQGSSVSLSSDGRIIAVGAPADNNEIGATWIYETRGSDLRQVGNKFVGQSSGCGSEYGAGYSVSLSKKGKTDGKTLALGGAYDNSGIGATWIFRYDGTTYQQLGNKLVGNDSSGPGANQGWSVSVSGGDAEFLAVGGPYDENGIGATWIFKFDGKSTYQQLGYKLVGRGVEGGKANQGSSVSLSSDNGNFLAVGGPQDNNYIGATWIFKYDGSTYQPLNNNKLVGTGYSGSPNQGSSVSLSADGQFLAVGGYNDSNGIGATWVFMYNGASSVYQQVNTKLVGDGALGSSYQGWSVSLSSSNGRPLLAVGGYGDNSGVGATWVFEYKGSSFRPFGNPNKVVGSGISGSPNQGKSVSLAGDTLAVGGANQTNGIGATWIFKNKGSDYQQTDKLVGSDASGSGFQGWSVSLSDSGYLAVGNPFDNDKVGAAWIFKDDGSTYNPFGTKFTPACSSRQGWSVSVSSDEGTFIAVGGPRDNRGVGATWIFIKDGSSYQQLGNKLVGNDASGSSYQGSSVSLSSDGIVLAVGGPYDNNEIGAIWIFTYNGFIYSQWGGKVVGKEGSAEFLSTVIRPRQGWSVSLSSDGRILASGSPFDSDETGATWIFVSNTSLGTYSQSGSKLIGSGSVFPARQGWSVSLSSDGSILAVGGPVDGPSYASRIGSTWIFQLDGSTGTYHQLGDKLVGRRYLGYSSQGMSVSLSSDGSLLAVGGFSDTFGFTPNADVSEAYIISLLGFGATWIFARNERGYDQVGSKLVGTGYVGNSSQQGYCVSLSGDGNVLGVGGPGDNNSTGATWIFSSTPPTNSTSAPTPAPPAPAFQCIKRCLADYLGDRLVCHWNVGPVILPKSVCVIQARLKKTQCLWKTFAPTFHCLYDSPPTPSVTFGIKALYDEIKKVYNCPQCYTKFQSEKNPNRQP